MHVNVVLILALAASSLSAQTAAPRSATSQRRAAATITASDVARRIGGLLRGLRRTAGYRRPATSATTGPPSPGCTRR